jgi:hypothetical protein
MNGMSSGWAYSGYTDNDNGIMYTWEWDFAPTYTVGQVSFNDVSGEGEHHTGVLSYRHRPQRGPDQSVSVGDPNNWGSWLPYVYADNCTGITFASIMGTDQEAYILGNLFFW